jgi:hypothetical protein
MQALQFAEFVKKAVQKGFDRLRNERHAELAERLLVIGKDCAAHLKEQSRLCDHGEFFYDKNGLPK